MSETLSPYFKFVEFNEQRAMRGAPAARVEVDADGDWLWMSRRDLQMNRREFGKHPELAKALLAYGAWT